MAKASRLAKKGRKVDPSYRVVSKEEFFPVQRIYQLGVISDGPYANTVKFHSIPRALCEVNNRLYRTARLYNATVELDNDAPAGNYEVYVLANTWMLTKAYQAAKAAYETAIVEERAAIDSDQMARWQDFRPNQATSAEVIGAFLADQALTQGERNDGEHATTLIYDAAGNARVFTLADTTGASTYSLYDEYDKMGAVDNNPQNVEAGGYNDLLADTQAAQVTDLQQRGERPPYSNPNFNDRIWVKVATLTNAATGSQRLSTGVLDIPFGYVWIKAPSATFPDAKLTVRVKAGKYKGVSAHSMGA